MAKTTTATAIASTTRCDIPTLRAGESEPLGYAPNGMPFYTVEDYMTYYNYMSEMSSRSNYLRPGSNDFNGGWDTYDVVSNSFGNESWNGSTPSFGSGQDMLNYMNANGYNHYDSNNGFAIYTQDQSFDAACAYNDNFGSWGNTVAGSRRAAQYNYDNGLGAVNFSLMQSISANSVAISGSYNYNNRANPYKDFQGAFFGNGQDAINFAGMLSQNLYIEVTTLRTPINGGFLVLPFGNDCDYAHSSFSYIKSNGCYFFDWNGGRYEFDAMAHTHPFNSYPSISDQINAGKIGIPSYIFCPNKVFVTTGIGQYSPTNSINFFEQ